MPKIVDVEQKRSELVAASWEVISSEGLSGATLKRVAAEAGCTTGMLTYYFPDRDALLVESLRTAHYAAAARMLKAAKKAEKDTDRLRAVVLEGLPLDNDRLREWKVWIAFWGAAAGGSRLASENSRRYDEWRELLEAVLLPLSKSAAEIDSQLSWLIALIDGLGLRLTLLAADPKALAAAQKDARLQVDRAVAALS